MNVLELIEEQRKKYTPQEMGELTYYATRKAHAERVVVETSKLWQYLVEEGMKNRDLSGAENIQRARDFAEQAQKSSLAIVAELQKAIDRIENKD